MNQRDYTKYRFQGQSLGKGRLVLALVRRYVADHPMGTFAELVKVFPPSLQAVSPLQFSGVRTVVARIEDVPEQEASRFFLGQGETISLADGEVAVSREWNLVNIQNVLAQAQTLGYAPEAIPR
jgi:hypothetical protein